jgi:hypothetical protein
MTTLTARTSTARARARETHPRAGMVRGGAKAPDEGTYRLAGKLKRERERERCIGKLPRHLATAPGGVASVLDTYVPLELTRKPTPSSKRPGPSPKRTLSVPSERPATRRPGPDPILCSKPYVAPWLRVHDEATIDTPDGVVKSPRCGAAAATCRGPWPAHDAPSRGTEAPRARARRTYSPARTISKPHPFTTLPAVLVLSPAACPLGSAPARRRESAPTPPRR